MTVIDIDSHFVEPLDWFEVGFPALAAQLPPMNLVDVFARSARGDQELAPLPPAPRSHALAALPAQLVPALERLAAAGSSGIDYAAALAQPTDARTAALGAPWRARGACDPGERLGFLDEHGIDHQFVLPGAPGLDPFIRAGESRRPALAVDCLYAWNEWAAEALAGFEDRLTPVTLIDLTDVPRALAELTRMRALGSRCLNVCATIVGRRSWGHPDFEVVWATAEDYGMAVVLRSGTGRSLFDLGRGSGLAAPLPSHPPVAPRGSPQIPEIVIGAMILTGVFDRHPGLAFLVSGFGIAWLPSWLQRLDGVGLGSCSGTGGATRLALRSSDYAERQLYVAPQPGEALYPTIEQVRGIVHFATGYPHPDGSLDATALFAEEMSAADSPRAARFFGAQLAAQLNLAPAARPTGSGWSGPTIEPGRRARREERRARPIDADTRHEDTPLIVD
ncbi:MAG: hypothetical protein ABS81_20305 [Pseudonocardia sp. SCN 72-86]|nr:MAG: hypothetical protein ABS81_20305 [Pseudonocardia sp. SCN 72-86]